MKGLRLSAALMLGLLTGSAQAVAAQEEEVSQPPEEFSGHLTCCDSVRDGENVELALKVGEDAWLLTRRRGGGAYELTATNSDPRLEGTYHYSEDSDVYQGPETVLAAAMGTLRIQNDEGAWQGSFPYAFLADGSGTTGSAVLEGEGAYEGLSTIMAVRFLFPECAMDTRGLIVGGEAPPTPEPFIAE